MKSIPNCHDNEFVAYFTKHVWVCSLCLKNFMLRNTYSCSQNFTGGNRELHTGETEATLNSRCYCNAIAKLAEETQMYFHFSHLGLA